ncbi:MAG TPA: S8 family serine peptidase [Sphingomicrobium sp.]|nr:S8 family serine peptidase [Sphingomicrobium sp.]
MSKRPIFTALLLVSLAATSAPGQLLGGSGPVGGTVGGITGGIGSAAGRTLGGIGGPAGQTLGSLGGPIQNTVGGIGGAVEQSTTGLNGAGTSIGKGITSYTFSLDRVSPPREILFFNTTGLADWRKARLEAFIRSYPNMLEADDEGQPVRKGQLIAIDPDSASLAAAQRAGFRLVASQAVDELGLRMVTLAVPKGMSARKGLKTLRATAPNLQCDYDHVYEPAGGALLPATNTSLAALKPVRAGTRIAMIDGGVASHPSLAGTGIEQRGFVGPPQPTGHGTAIGSLLVGNQGRFRGAARGAQLYVGDVYAGNPAAGSATAIVKALAWAASKRPAVINISLVGPSNPALGRAIGALRARGIAVIAPVGNDGPAAPPQYPASYSGVIAVTGVDAADRALREAGRATHLDFAAPGADLVAALPGNGYTPVRGTSFAAPFVAARLAATGSPAVLAVEAVPGKGKVGRGIVCRSCRVAPKLVGLKIR